jgi:purine-binding chemotaxis protein CheW
MGEAINVAEKEEVVDNRKVQLIVFKLGEEEYGLQIDQIKEVVLTPHITRLPQTPPYVKGVANIRGNIIAIVDLAEKFGIDDVIDRVEQENLYTLVLESEEIKAGVLVKEVPNTLNIPVSSIEDAGNIIHDNNTEQSYIQGIVKLEDRLIIKIDLFKVLSDQDLAGVFTRRVANGNA